MKRRLCNFESCDFIAFNLQESLKEAQSQISSLVSEKESLIAQLTSEKDSVSSQHYEEVNRLKSVIEQHQQDVNHHKELLAQSKLVIVLSMFFQYITVYYL